MSPDQEKLFRVRALASLSVLFLCILGAFLLWKFRPVTENLPPEEPVLTVDLLTAAPTQVRVQIETHGVVRALRRAEIASEVSGRVVEMPRVLRAGDRVSADELLLRVDPVDAESGLAEARAAEARVAAGLESLRVTEAADRRLLSLQQRAAELAEREFTRLRDLAADGQSVSIAAVEAAERAATQASAQVVQLDQALALLPSRRQELESEGEAARARSARAAAQVARCEIRAPFAGRLEMVEVERGEILQPSRRLFTLVDDAVRELEVPVSAEELRDWIAFEANGETAPGWFPPLRPEMARIEWSAGNQDLVWEGQMNRVVRFDATTRTALIALRVEADLETSEALPLTEGMFCRVWLPGRELSDVIPLPRTAVSFDGKVYLAREGRLRTAIVTVAHAEGDLVYVSEGLSAGDEVIVTRLVAPLEGARVRARE